MPERSKQLQYHPVLGVYEQIVFDDKDEARHEDLPTGGEYGWQMPLDSATKLMLKDCKGKEILDLGCGWGETISIPAMDLGASHVYSADIEALQFYGNKKTGEEAPLKKYINSADSRLTPILIKRDWWSKPLSSNPKVSELLGVDEQFNSLVEHLDLVGARHSIQFGTPDTIMNVFDLASLVLKPGGKFVGINFTEYTQYCYDFDGGQIMAKIERLNKMFAAGINPIPGSYLNRQNGPLGLCLKDLAKQSDLGRDDDNFTYIDAHTLRGLIDRWNISRANRNLPPDLTILQGFYFSPDRITSFNKLVGGEKRIQNQENYLFVLEKTKAAAANP